PSETRWPYEVIERQIGHLTRLVDDLLDVSRITRGNLEIRREPADLADIVRAATEGIQPALAAKDLHLQVALPAGPIPVSAAAVLGARAPTTPPTTPRTPPPPGGKLGPPAERGPAGVTISVRDSGSGIPPEELPRLFQMFYQSSKGGVPSQGGLGIGLALVRL